MRCRDAKQQLTVQRDTEPDRPMLRPEPGRTYRTISTERIMQAVERERRVSQQLEHIQSQQQVRLARASKVGPKIALGAFLTTGALILGLFALFLFQPEVFISLLSPLSGFVDAFYALMAWVQAGLTLISSHNWILSGVAFMVVIMMGMWLRLMRYPREE